MKPVTIFESAHSGLKKKEGATLCQNSIHVRDNVPPTTPYPLFPHLLSPWVPPSALATQATSMMEDPASWRLQ
jgi:hypothetical protein